MKYQLGNIVINSDHIVKVVHFQPGTCDDEKSHCGIQLTGATDGWSEWLSGEQADLFWEAYMRDSYSVWSERAKPAPEPEALTYIEHVYTENTGGGCMVDVIALKDGRVIGLTDESIGVYPSLDSWQSNEDPTHYLNMVTYPQMTKREIEDMKKQVEQLRASNSQLVSTCQAQAQRLVKYEGLG